MTNTEARPIALVTVSSQDAMKKMPLVEWEATLKLARMNGWEGDVTEDGISGQDARTLALVVGQFTAVYEYMIPLFRVVKRIAERGEPLTITMEKDVWLSERQ